MEFNLLEIGQKENSILKNLLDFDLIIKEISHYTFFESTLKNLEEITLKKVDEITLFYNLIEKTFELIRTSEINSIENCFNHLPTKKSYDEIFLRLTKQSILNFSEFNTLFLHLEGKRNLEKITPKDIYSIFPEISPQEEQALYQELKSFRSLVSANGEVDYERHPVLREYFKKQQEIERKIKHEINRLLTSEEMKPRLRYDQYDLINDRYVLPIRSDNYQASLGLIMGHSDSGMTLYVEPFSVRELSNARLEIIAQIDEVIFSICQGFTENLSPYAFIFQGIREAFYQFDEIFSKAKYSFYNNFERPRISHDNRTTLYDFYHPLLKKPIKNNLKLFPDQRGLIISGPNTGGKTVTLKTLALVHLFVHYGLFLPVSKATVAIYQKIFYFGNDQQNLDMGLSSFAGEVKNYLDLLNELNNEGTLILVDEIFNSTSSEEASALALSFFDKIFEFDNVKIIVSTHHQMLKSFTHEDRRFLCAHVGFDLYKNAPTYRLLVGTPGSSMAIKIFENLARKKMETKSLIRKAQEILDSRYQSYENLLQKLSKKQVHLDKLIRGNEKIKKELSNKKKSIDAAMKLEMQKSVMEYEKKFKKMLKDVQDLMDEFKNQKITGRQLDSQVRRIHNSYVREKEKTLGHPKTIKNNQEGSRSIPKEYIEGEIYFSEFLNSKVTLKKIDLAKKSATVQKGSMTIKVPLETLYFDANLNQLQKEKKQESIIIQTPDSDENKAFHLEHDLRGLRLEDFQERVEIILNDLLLRRIPYALIIHGHGDGILKKWLRNTIDKNPDFAWKRSEGNDGSTEIHLR